MMLQKSLKLSREKAYFLSNLFVTFLLLFGFSAAEARWACESVFLRASSSAEILLEMERAQVGSVLHYEKGSKALEIKQLINKNKDRLYVIEYQELKSKSGVVLEEVEPFFNPTQFLEMVERHPHFFKLFGIEVIFQNHQKGVTWYTFPTLLTLNRKLAWLRKLKLIPDNQLYFSYVRGRTSNQSFLQELLKYRLPYADDHFLFHDIHAHWLQNIFISPNLVSALRKDITATLALTEKVRSETGKKAWAAGQLDSLALQIDLATVGPSANQFSYRPMFHVLKKRADIWSSLLLAHDKRFSKAERELILEMIALYKKEPYYKSYERLLGLNAQDAKTFEERSDFDLHSAPELSP
jgi:hypothetical protein